MRMPELTLKQGDINWLLFNSQDHITQEIMRTGRWASKEVQTAWEHVKDIENPTVLDIGGNLGAFSVQMGKLLQQKGSGTVHAFEPQRILFYQLNSNMLLNQLDNVHAYNVAVSNESGKMEIPQVDYVKSTNYGSLSISEEFRKHQRGEDTDGIVFYGYEWVDVVTLDDMYDTVDFIKVDVEGWELEVFKGATQLLERSKCPVIFEVWNREWYKEKSELTQQYMMDLGYSLKKSGNEIIATHKNL